MGATAGAQITLLVLQPTSSTTYRVVAFDSQQLPNPLPFGNIATFPIASGLSVPAGSVLGLLGGPTGMVGCLGVGGAQDSASFGTASPPMVDASYTQTGTAASRLLNVEVDLVQSSDVGVVSSATPATINAGGVGFLSFAVSNDGPSAGTVTLVDSVPAGLSVLAAFVGSGTCTAVGQDVTCSTGALAPGSSTPAGVVVFAAGPGAFSNTGAVTSSIADPNPANNSATATLTVNPLSRSAAPQCRVVTLKSVPLPEAKAVLKALGCAIGKVRKRSSTKIPKGEVISTSPGPSLWPAGTRVNLVQSSGKPAPKKHKRRKPQD